jgi:hypothetical protein
MTSPSVILYGTAKHYWFPPLSRLCRRQLLAVEVDVRPICICLCALLLHLQPRLRRDPDLIIFFYFHRERSHHSTLSSLFSTLGTTLISDSLQ